MALYDVLASMALAGTTALIAVNFTHPIDTWKTRLQVDPKFSVVGMVRKEGVLALWKGIEASWLREASYTSIKLGAYAPIRDAMGADEKNGSFMLKFLAGSLVRSTVQFPSSASACGPTAATTNPVLVFVVVVVVVAAPLQSRAAFFLFVFFAAAVWVHRLRRWQPLRRDEDENDDEHGRAAVAQRCRQDHVQRLRHCRLLPRGLCASRACRAADYLADFPIRVIVFFPLRIRLLTSPVSVRKHLLRAARGRQPRCCAAARGWDGSRSRVVPPQINADTDLRG
jgi:hypothetical protein